LVLTLKDIGILRYWWRTRILLVLGLAARAGNCNRRAMPLTGEMPGFSGYFPAARELELGIFCPSAAWVGRKGAAKTKRPAPPVAGPAFVSMTGFP
jgi:hypothetical protein